LPDIVFEITSPGAEDVDRGSKLELYTRLGAREYYIYDSQQVMVPPLRAYTRQGDALIPLALLPTGAVVSPLLGAELWPVGIYLRVIDPDTGLPFRTAEEEWRDRIAEERARIAAQGRADAEERARRAIEKRAELAEERAARAEAALTRRGRRLAHGAALRTGGMWLVGAASNVCWPHASLCLPALGGRQWQVRPPAMAAGLTDHSWTLEEMRR